MSDEARRSGAIMSTETVTALADLSDATEHARQTMLAAIGTAFSKVAPSLTPAVAQISELVGALIEKMAPAFTWIGEKVIPALTGMLTGEGESSLGNALSGVMQIMTITKDIFVALWPIIKDAVQMFVDFFAGPTGQALIKGLLEAIGSALEILQQVFAQVWGAVQPIVQTFIDFLSSPTGGKLIALFMDAVTTALTILQKLFEAAWPAIETALELAQPGIELVLAAIEAAVWLVTKAVDALQDAWWWISGQSWKSDLRDFRRTITDETKAMVSDYQAAVKKGAKNIVIGPNGEIITPQARGTIATRPQVALIGEAGAEVVAPVNDPARSADLLYRSGLLAKIAGLSGGDVSNRKALAGALAEIGALKKKAEGGIVYSPVIAGEAGPEAILPLNDPKRFWDVLGQALGRAGIVGAAPSAAPTSNVSTTYNIHGLTIDGSRMKTPDFDGFLDSLQTAIRMRPQTT
jgi:hypothetical protein